MTHTATPWNLCRTIISDAITHWHITGDKYGSSYPICNHTIEINPSGEEQLANAAFIVRAVNNHDQLVKILEAAQQFIGNLPDNTMDKDLSLKHINEALSNAREV